MATKTITITEAAYKSIHRLKRGDESFSDLFLRLGSKPTKVSELFGIIKLSEAEVKELRTNVESGRKSMDAHTKKRAEDVRARLQRLD